MKGIGTSAGIAVGKAFIVNKDISIEKAIISDSESEIARLIKAVNESERQLDAFLLKLRDEGNADSIEILRVHKAMLNDMEFISSIKSFIIDESVNSEFAVQMAAKRISDSLRTTDDAYLKERAFDIEDVGNRIICNLSGGFPDFSSIPEESVIVTKYLSPSDAAAIDKCRLKGFVTEEGSSTSHTAIIARTAGIPAVTGIDGIVGAVRNGDIIIVDGFKGEVILNPGEDTINLYKAKKLEHKEYRDKLKKLKNLPAVTLDGREFIIEANIGSGTDVGEVLNSGAQGIGLFRTEFVYMNSSDFPSEDDQFYEYKKVVSKMGQKRVTIRTLDIGGDKELPYFRLDKEAKPSICNGGIRFCLERKDIFKTQLKAILRAGVYGNVSIMYPMITDVSEVIRANRVLEEAKTELKLDMVPFCDDIKVGIMIETPAAAMSAHILAREVDFFSIGTNDLIQYTLATERSSRTEACNDYLNADVLRLIRDCICQAHKHGIYAAMCGEMASDPETVKILLGLGLDVFSMNPSAIPVIKDIIRSTTVEEAAKCACKALNE
ncbi:MAG: phosphoenolpyruvate--protein phosphotransferase [Clostridia bacterium]|nr:phosphoenolpyruvate--protein phosphotransferase [Clostridia bacterium]